MQLRRHRSITLGILALCLASQCALASQLTDANIGSTGSVTYNQSANSYTLATSGSPTSWIQNFYYASLTGNFDVIAQVTGYTGNTPFTGIIAANSLATNGDGTVAALLPSVSALPNPAAFYYVNPGASVGTLSPSSGSYSWLQLSRNGNTFEEQASANGTSWSNLGSQSIALNTTLDVGIYINDTAAASSTFANISGLPLLSSTAATTAVPEPNAISLLALALLTAVVLRRKRLTDVVVKS